MAKKSEIESILSDMVREIRKTGASSISNADVQLINKGKVAEYDARIDADIAKSKEAGMAADYARIIAESAFIMGSKHIGALMIFPGLMPIALMASRGTSIKAPVTSDILEDIFFPGTKLHDGAVIIRRGIIEKAAVFVNTISRDDVGYKCGARHRAAMGITKITDAIALIVSEETGKVEIARKGKMETIDDPEALIDILNKLK